MLEDILSELEERETDRLDAKKLELTEKIYPNMPATIKRTSEITGMPEDLLVRSCIQAAWHYRDLEWRDVLDIIRSFYLAKRNVEEKQDANG